MPIIDQLVPLPAPLPASAGEPEQVQDLPAEWFSPSVHSVYFQLFSRMLALPLSAVNPRRGRSYQYGVALLAFVFYYNLLNLGQNWIASGRYSLPGLLLVLHGGVLLLALGWLWVQHRQWSWRNLWPAQDRGAQA